jgi:ribosomal protein L22
VAEDSPTPTEPEPVAAAAEPTGAPPATPEDKPKAKAKAVAAKPKAAAAAKPASTPKAAPKGKAKAPTAKKVEPPPAAGHPKRGARLPEGVRPPVVRAQAKYVRTSARKARLVCDHIRGKSVVEARAILAFAPRAVADDWAKLLNSAVANAEHNHELLGEDLRVKEAFADEGPTLKRFRPRAMGRATPIRKRTSHLTITLTPKE